MISAATCCVPATKITPESIRADERSELDVAGERGLFSVGGETLGGGHRLAVPHLAGLREPLLLAPR